MRMGHHGYQPAGGGGDGVLAVTSSSLSEIKVWLTHTPTYHWTPFPAVDQTQHAYMNFQFNMNPLTSKRWNAGSVCRCLGKAWQEWYVTLLWLCIRVRLRVCFARQKRYVYNHKLIWWPAGPWSNTHVDGRKFEVIFWLASETHEHCAIHREKLCFNYCRRFVVLLQEQIQQWGLNIWMPHY